MNPMITAILIGEKRLEMEEQQRGQCRFYSEELLVNGWPKTKRSKSILAWLPRITLARRQPPCESLPEPCC